MFIIQDIWKEIKSFLFHNIKIHGKHLKKDIHIQNYNNVIKIFPSLIQKYNGARIIYNSNKEKTRFVKFVYVLKHKKIRKLIIIYQKIFFEYQKNLNCENIAWTGRPMSHISEFKEEYNSYINHKD